MAEFGNGVEMLAESDDSDAVSDAEGVEVSGAVEEGVEAIGEGLEKAGDKIEKADVEQRRR